MDLVNNQDQSGGGNPIAYSGNGAPAPAPIAAAADVAGNYTIRGPGNITWATTEAPAPAPVNSFVTNAEFIPDPEAPAAESVGYPADDPGKAFNVSDYVSGLYRTYYNREADAPGLAWWTDQITRGIHDRRTAAEAFAGTPDMSPNPDQSLAAYLSNPIDYTHVNNGVPVAPDVTALGTNPTGNPITNALANLLGTQVVTNPTGISNQVSGPGINAPLAPTTSNPFAGAGLGDLTSIASLFGLFAGANNQIDTRRSSDGSGVVVIPSATPEAAPAEGSNNKLLIILALVAIAIPIAIHFYAKYKP